MENKEKKNSYVYPFLAIVVFVSLALFLTKPQEVDSTPENWLTNWLELNSMLTGRRALAAVTANGYIYVLGGVDKNGRYVKEVEFARILANGKLDKWQKTSSLNQGRFYLAAVTSGGYIYAIGGGSGPLGDNNQPTAVVEKAKILTDGTLEPWKYEKELTTPRRGLKVVSYNKTIYALGGYNGTFLTSVERTSIDNNGLLTGWVVDSEQAKIDRYIHSAAVDKNNIYLLGGHVRGKNKMSYGDVEMTRINEDASLSPWLIEKTTLRLPRFIASSIAMKDYLYLIAGHNGANRLRQVEFTKINKSGHPDHWSFTSPLLYARSAAAVVKHNEMIYVLGGMGKNEPLNKVEMASQLTNGQLGSYSN